MKKLKTPQEFIVWPRKRALSFTWKGQKFKDGEKLRSKSLKLSKKNSNEFVYFEIGYDGYIEISVGNMMYRSLNYYLCPIEEVEGLIVGN